MVKKQTGVHGVQRTRQCYKCKHWRALRYYKKSNKSGDLCVRCNFCRLKQNSYLNEYNRSEKGQKRRHKKTGDGQEGCPRGPYNVQNRKSERVLLCTACNNKIGHIVYRKYRE